MTPSARVATPSDGGYAPFTRSRALRWILLPFARATGVYFRARVSGVEHIPRDRPVIYVGKHPRSYLYLETLLLGRVTFWGNDRPAIRVLEQRGTSLHRAPVIAWMRRQVHAIPAGIEHAVDALRHGESVLIFPGGSRELYGEADVLQWEGRTGFARLAILAQVPVLPFAILGADRQHLGRVRVGGSSVWLPPLPLPVRFDYRFGVPIAPPFLRQSSTGDVIDSTAPDDAVVREFAARVRRATQSLIDDGLAARGAVRGRARVPAGSPRHG